ncbi:MAG: cyclin family protein [Candidatus Babeliales bacterium]|jgi:hypothetical protein
MKKISLLISAFFLIISVSIENVIAMKRHGKSSRNVGSQKRQCKKDLEDTHSKTIAPANVITMVDAQTQTVGPAELEASHAHNPSQITTPVPQVKVINAFVGPTSFADWLEAEGIIEWLKIKGINDCLIRMLLNPNHILASVFEQTTKLITPLTDDTGVTIESVNINNEPLEIRPLLGTGGINKEMNPLLYLLRIDKYCPCTPSYYVVALIYLQRLIKKNTPTIFNNISFYRTYLAAFIVASKWLQDKIHPIEHYAEVGGIPKNELISIEECFLNLIDFDIFVSPEEFKESFKQLIKPS